MTPSPKCETLVKQFEGCKLKAYLCPAKVPTIGYGSTGPDIHIGLTWTQEQADARFHSDLGKFAGSVERLLDGKPTTQGQFDAMVSFSYNLGLGNFGGSTLLKLHKAGDYDGAQAQFARWNKAGGKVLDGLTKRRAAEAALYGGQA